MHGIVTTVLVVDNITLKDNVQCKVKLYISTIYSIARHSISYLVQVYTACYIYLSMDIS